MMKRKFFLVATLLLSCEDKLSWIKEDVPIVYSIDPVSGTAGTIVTIAGANFDIPPYKSNVTVTIHQTPAVITEASSSVLRFIAPDETTGPVVVSVNNRSAKNQPIFTYK